MGGTKGNWYRLNICVFPKFICWNLMVTEGGAFGRWLSHKGEALMDGVSALIKETLESSLSLLPCEDTVRRWLFGHSEKMAIYELASGPSSDIDSASSLILDLPGSGIVSNKCLLFLSYPLYGILFYQSEETKTAAYFSLEAIQTRGESGINFQVLKAKTKQNKNLSSYISISSETTFQKLRENTDLFRQRLT